MSRKTLIALAINNLVIAGGFVLLHLRLVVVEGAVERLGPVMLRQLGSALSQASENAYYLGLIINYLFN